MKVYIAGKITKNPNAKTEFHKAEQELKKLGFEAVNPFKIFDGLDLQENEIMIQCLQYLNECDVIALLPNYYESLGTQIEIAWSRKFNKNVWRIYYNQFGVIIDKFNKLPNLHHKTYIEFLTYLKGKYNITEKRYRSKTKDITHFKHSLRYLLRLQGLNYVAIATMMECDHSTVINSCKILKEAEKYDTTLHEYFMNMQKEYEYFFNLNKAG